MEKRSGSDVEAKKQQQQQKCRRRGRLKRPNRPCDQTYPGWNVLHVARYRHGLHHPTHLVLCRPRGGAVKTDTAEGELGLRQKQTSQHDGQRQQQTASDSPQPDLT
ncbi:hypothetical protein Pmani_037254 [Petrolisthes manimaculis]|uniref:Uncharacterized protein n=1 Tax=Petrolisthes manimaculis TaxID=1843537 RepID=A0AAE1NI40_9EUCA|nr:hypothetical protein Pmani_037254 [Petrolisthes manimaculis]